MNENINLVEKLKDCPKGTKLYSTVFGDVKFMGIKENATYPIIVKVNDENFESFTADGRTIVYFDGECTLFPSKDQRDWSKFTAPWCTKERDTIDWLEKQGEQKKQVHFPKFTFDDILALQCCMETVKKVQEDEKLYEKLNLIHSKMYDAYCLGKKGETSSILSNSLNNGKNEQKSADKIEPKFKIGDKIRHKYDHNICFTITDNK